MKEGMVELVSIDYKDPEAESYLWGQWYDLTTGFMMNEPLYYFAICGALFVVLIGLLKLFRAKLEREDVKLYLVVGLIGIAAIPIIFAPLILVAFLVVGELTDMQNKDSEEGVE